MGNIETLVIGDFDTAKQVSEGNQAKTVVGTPGNFPAKISMNIEINKIR